MADETLQQSVTDFRDIDYGFFESRVIFSRWLLKSTDLANKLQRGGADLFRCGRLVRSAQGLDASAHIENVDEVQCSLLGMGQLVVHSFQTSREMGAAAAQHAAQRIRELSKIHDSIAVVFATGASQLEVLRSLVTMKVPWEQVIGFHLDEYLGIGLEHPASFRHYLQQELVLRVPIRQFHWLGGDTEDPGSVCQEYAAALKANPPQLCLLGIGENGHLAFNDPAEADFCDPADVKIVSLDGACRQQQVNERWFEDIDRVPSRAITLTIPAILRIPELIVSVPGARKATIVARTLSEKVSTACPASILREHPNAHLYLDSESSRDLPVR